MLQAILASEAFRQLLYLGAKYTSNPTQEGRLNVQFSMPNGERYTIYQNGYVRHTGIANQYQSRGAQSVLCGGKKGAPLLTLKQWESKLQYVAESIPKRQARLVAKQVKREREVYNRKHGITTEVYRVLR